MNQTIPADTLLRRFTTDRPKIVCLCGSTRFPKAWAEARYKLTLRGLIVLTIGCDTKSDEGLRLTEAQKAELDELHKRKIELADEVFVLNVGGYIGASTLSEIDHALKIGREIKFLEDGHTWATVPEGTRVPGSGVIVEAKRAAGGGLAPVYVTFERGVEDGGIPTDAAGWREGCNRWTTGQSSTKPVPVGMNRKGGGFLFARRARHYLDGATS